MEKRIGKNPDYLQYDFDSAFLTELEPTVRHYEVFDS